MSEHDPRGEVTLAMRAALDAATALAEIRGHIKECTRRYGDTVISTARLHGRIDEILTLQEKTEHDQRDRHEAWVRDDRDRREQRDRDTAQAIREARRAYFGAIVTVAAVIVGIVLQHIWK